MPDFKSALKTTREAALMLSRRRMEALERALDGHALEATRAADAVVVGADVGEDAALEVGGER